MEYRRLGSSGLQVSTLSFGAWVTFGNQVDTGLAADCMKAAYDAGVNFFDNAETYANGRAEEVMGAALKKLGWDRDTYLVSSKVFFGRVNGPVPTQRGLSRKHIYDCCHQALRRLQVDYLDMYFCHRPDFDTPVEETVRAMTELVQQGKVLYWGTSEWPADRIMEAYGVAREFNLIPPTMEQPQYNMLCRERVEVEYAPLYEKGLGTTIWSPLASGVLTGKYKDGVPEGSRLAQPGYEWLRALLDQPQWQHGGKVLPSLTEIAGDLGVGLPQLAIAWCVKNPQVSTAITGASRLEQVHANMKAAEAVEKLTDDALRRIEEVLGNAPKRSPRAV